MNARQKAKQYKKLIIALYEDYVSSAMRCQEMFQKIADSKLHCGAEVRVKPDDSISKDDIYKNLVNQLIATDAFKQSVVLYIHTDLFTGEHVYQMKLQTIKPEIEEE